MCWPGALPVLRCVSRATERLFLSYRSSDEEGNLALPSPFIADVADLFDRGWRRAPAPPAAGRRGLGPATLAPTERELDRARGRRPALREPGPSPAPDRTLAAERPWRTSATARSCRPARSRPTPTAPSNGWSSGSSSPSRWPPTPTRSPGAATCTTSLERAASRARRRGDAGHARGATRILEEVLAELAPGGRRDRPRAARVVRAALRAIEADLRRYLEHEAATGAVGGRAGSSCGSGSMTRRGRCRPWSSARAIEVRVRGVIDRVDVDGAAATAIVRDYKSGAPAPSSRGALARRAPAPGRALHAGRPRAAGARRRWPASISRSAARTCARVGCSSRGRRSGRGRRNTDARDRPRSSTRCSRTPPRGRVATGRAAARGRADAVSRRPARATDARIRGSAEANERGTASR